MIKALLFALGMAFATAAMAQQYKWVGANGKVEYGDIPPPGVQATPLNPPVSAPAASAPAAKKDGARDLGPEWAFRKRQQEQREKEAKAAKERADVESRRVNCEESQGSLRSLQSGQRISTVNADGERVFIDDEQRAKEIERIQRAVNDWCK